MTSSSEASCSSATPFSSSLLLLWLLLLLCELSLFLAGERCGEWAGSCLLRSRGSSLISWIYEQRKEKVVMVHSLYGVFSIQKGN